jgi:hypothetical protein
MNRKARLSSAQHWLATQKGRTPVQIAKSYRKHYGVDWRCAIQELASFGVRLPVAWVAHLNRSLEGGIKARALRKADCELENRLGSRDWDEHFAYVAGCTSNGVPFGLTWDEWKRIQNAETGREGC